jgi:predicted transcriptional regulator
LKCLYTYSYEIFFGRRTISVRSTSVWLQRLNWNGFRAKDHLTIGGVDRHSNRTSVRDIVKPDIDYIDQNEIMSKAITIMREKKIRYLLIRGGESVKGILSVKGLLVYYEKWFELTF